MTYAPLKMAPCYKETLWGGRKLKQEYHKPDAPEVTAESWELAGHQDGNSLVAEGPLAGKSLSDLAELDRDSFWGTECPGGKFPVLVKLIDAAKDLSIQVHPSDRTARSELGEEGKAELWYIVDREPQAFLYFGFSERISKEEFLRRARDGSICEVLNRTPVERGDVFYILPGTIHAIGAGITVAEVQQSSNTTFRVYDFGRRGPDGAPRPLHLERAAEVLSYEPIVPEECRAASCSSFPGFTMTELFACRYFRAYRVDVRERAVLCCGGDSFQHLLCVEGEGRIVHGGAAYPMGRGESYFLPAALGEYELAGTCRALLTRL